MGRPRGSMLCVQSGKRKRIRGLLANYYDKDHVTLKSLLLSFTFDPLGRPTGTAGSDH